ncbi:hypothetical protein PILCRDRAFT_826476 [Piloderma croceum F 1598]|uniref:Uncharacterized protein n=1 Tax=Piloderma croceum (strain F 1598) TaxID=765440 RepID=A0A0C3AQT4_PILCF|nr:hypothetical protein PILCRDRAFT_826476 [Piloderma croceum F 1598]
MADMNIASDAEYDIGYMLKKRKIVSSEEGVRSQAEVQLHDLVKEVLEILGIDGRFERPDSGINQIVGEPDLSWLLRCAYNTKWAAPLEDLPRYFQRKNRHNVLERQSIDAVHQL